MRKTSLVIDDAMVERAREVLGTRGIKDTVDAALREVVVREARRQTIDRLVHMRGLDLNDPEVMAGAWR